MGNKDQKFKYLHILEENMAVTSIMTTEAAIKAKAGANVSAALTDTDYDAWVLQAESKVNIIARYNYSDGYAALNADVKHLMGDIVSSLVAMQAVAYDMSGYASRAEAEDIINVQNDNAKVGTSLLRDKKVQTFINGA